MKTQTSLLRAREMSLALLVIAVVEHGSLNADYSGAAPSASGLMRLGRDLLRRTQGAPIRAAAAVRSVSARGRGSVQG